MTPPPHIPTLDDVAKAAGVSTATVSRCLNTSEKVSPSAREKVMKAVEILGYTPNFGARAMAAKRTFTIGAIIPTMENAIFARGLQAFQEKLHDQGYTLLVSSSAYQPDVEAEQIKTLIARGADGLLLIGYARDPSVYEFLARRGVPVMIAWASDASRALASVGFDNHGAIKALTTQVLSMGHRNIGYISLVVTGNDRAEGRLSGVRDALAGQGLGADALSVIETDYAFEAGDDAFGQLMQSDDPPSVVMCGNDVLAVGALQRAQRMGLRVPEDVSITGFDDIELARIVTPQLTTVHVPHREMGGIAAENLVAMVETGRAGVSVNLPSEVKLRDSLSHWPSGNTKRP